MRAVVITKHGGPGVLKVQEQPTPPLSTGEIRIDVAAAGVNFADVMARIGLYPDAPKTPCVRGLQVAGTVIKVGDGVGAISQASGWWPSTKSCVRGFASEVVVPLERVALPEQVQLREGSPIPVDYSTASGGTCSDYGRTAPQSRSSAS